MSQPLLQLTGLTKSFGAVRALKGVSFDLRRGEVHALLGENGAGKSTLIKIITGAHQPDSGVIELESQRVRHLTPVGAHRLGIACIYQQPALFAELTVAENIALRLEPVNAWRRVRWSSRHVQARRLLDRVGARISTDREVRSLSMPEQQLVEIACVLGTGARIVIMDEPTSSLTQSEQGLLYGVVDDMRANGVGVIYISHRLEEIFALADRVTVLRDGESVGTRTLRGRDGAVGDERIEVPGISTAAGLSRSLSESELIQLMVGREVSQLFPPAACDPGEVLVSLRRLGRSASGVRNVNLDLRASEIVGLAGLVGAGRTELARILFGLTPADEGECILGGQRASIRSPRDAMAHGIAYLPEDRRRHGVILEMAVSHNVTMAIHERLFPHALLRPEAERHLVTDRLRELSVKASGPQMPCGSLSGGNQQKVALARWLATNPRLLILDEPTQGVDIGAKSEIHHIIRRLAKMGMAILMISSDLPEILGMSDRIAVMRGGEMVAVLPRGSSAHEVMAAALGPRGGSE